MCTALCFLSISTCFPQTVREMMDANQKVYELVDDYIANANLTELYTQKSTTFRNLFESQDVVVYMDHIDWFNNANRKDTVSLTNYCNFYSQKQGSFKQFQISDVHIVYQNNFSGSKDLNKCLNSLWITAMQSHWHDNVTILLCHVTKKTEDKAKGRTIPSDTSVEPSSTTTSEIDITPEADITSEPETEPKPASDKESSQPLFQKLGAKYVEKDTITPKQIAIAIATSLFILILIISLLFHKAQNRKFRSEDMMLMGTCVPIDSSQQDTTTQLETKYEKQAHESDSTDDISDNWVPGLKLNQDEEAATQAPSTRKDPNKDEKTETEKKKNEPEAEPTVKKGLLDEAIKKRVKQ